MTTKKKKRYFYLQLSTGQTISFIGLKKPNPNADKTYVIRIWVTKTKTWEMPCFPEVGAWRLKKEFHYLGKELFK